MGFMSEALSSTFQSNFFSSFLACDICVFVGFMQIVVCFVLILLETEQVCNFSACH
uniref:Uncharacterized protein n=1 Tax=Rhizophora mucronata TaxID=61149 RepID=A0A2P2PB21_RHIMU